jgi:DNA invertase Pin-like site-specific DNA recombinase
MMEQKVIKYKAIPTIKKAKRVAAYARVSTGKDAMLHSLSSQVSYYANYIQNHKGWRYAGVYADEAVSGTLDNRENFLKLLADCRLGKIDMIITKSISRFSRNTITLIHTVRELKSLGVDVFFEEQNLHSLSGDGEVMLSILASFAQEEARSVSENMLWRIQQNFKQGLVYSKTMLGYRIEDSTLIVVPSEAEVVKRVFNLYLEGYGTHAIAKLLNKEGVPSRHKKQFSKSTIQYMLRNKDYTGELHLQRTYQYDYLSKKTILNKGEKTMYIVHDAHEAIIDLSTFEAVQEELARRDNAYPHSRLRHNHLYSGLIKCGHCGCTLGRGKLRDKYIWRCNTYRAKGKDVCPLNAIPESEIERLIKEVIHSAVIEEKNLRSTIKTMVARNDRTIEFHLADGTSMTKAWIPSSRKHSWTEEMKERARKISKQKHKERREAYEENHSHSVND